MKKHIYTSSKNNSIKENGMNILISKTAAELANVLL